MIGPFDVTQDYAWQDPHDLQGRGGSASYRLTRRRDGVSLLLHAVDKDQAERCSGEVVCETLSNSSEPFVTPLRGPVRLSGRYFVIEAIPPCVPLIDAWKTVVSETPQSARGMLLEAVDQIDRLLSHLAAYGQSHGAVCAENVILTTTGTYGLLAARFDHSGQDIWIRRADATESSRSRDQGPRRDSVVAILRAVLTETTLPDIQLNRRRTQSAESAHEE